MTHHSLEMPITAEQARALKVGDTVILERRLFGIRDATLIHMFDHGRTTQLDLARDPLKLVIYEPIQHPRGNLDNHHIISNTTKNNL